MKVNVFYDKTGHITAIAEVKEDKSIPSARIVPKNNFDSSEIELTDELARLPLIDLHTKYKVRLRGKESSLIPISTE